MATVVPNRDAVVSIPSTLVDRAAPPRNPLLEPPHSYAKLTSTPSLTADPPQLSFSFSSLGSHAGAPGAHEASSGPARLGSATLRLINTSAQPIRLHIHPPLTPFFQMEVVKRGRLMPGMAERVTVHFFPADIRHYHDQIRVHAEGGNLLVPLHAYPTTDDLALPSRIDLGTVPLGSEAVRELPLRSGTAVGFDFRVTVLSTNFTGDELSVEPLEGTVPPEGALPIAVRYTPIRLATARMELELRISQPGFAPRIIEVVGTCVPGGTRQRHLRRLEAASMGGDPAAGGLTCGDSMGGTAPNDQFGWDGESSPSLGATVRSVLHAPTSPSRVAAAASRTDHLGRPGGGGAGGGDEVTRALAAERRAAIGRSKVPVRYPVDRDVLSLQAAEETLRDGFRVPPELDSQVNVNRLLTQTAGKLPVAEIRSVVEAQNLQAARDREAVERAAAASVTARLQHALAANAGHVIALFEELDVDGSGAIDKREFALALPLLGVHDATDHDMAKLFDAIDTDCSGMIEYGELKKAIKIAKVSRQIQIGASVDASAPAAELDIALQGSDRTPQLKEALFIKEVTELEKFEKSKEIKSFIAKGAPPCPATTVDATRAARKAFYSAEERARRAAGRARTIAEVREGDRATVTVDAARAAEAAQPSFDVYSNDAFRLREAALALFQQGVRTAMLRARATERLGRLSAALAQRGASLRDARQLISARTRAVAGGAAHLGASAALEGPVLDLAHIKPFSFPSAMPTAAEVGAPPMELLPLEPFDDVRTFALRVPRRYKQMGYRPVPLTNAGEIEADPLTSRPMRTGATYESGAVLPTGEATAFPLAPLPPLLLAPKPARPPAPVPALTSEDVLGEPPTADAADPDPFKCKAPPKVYQRPPEYIETDVEYHLRARPLVCSDSWLREPTGLGAARTLLREETLSSRWQPLRRPWSEVVVPLPRTMRGPESKDLDTELSEDESDTELSVVPLTEVRLRDVFEIPAVDAEAAGEGDGAAAAEEAAGGEANSPRAAEPRSIVLAMLDAGEASGVPPERFMPVDRGSAMAVAEARLQADLAARRKANRARLPEALDRLNQFIPDPRLQLRCII